MYESCHRKVNYPLYKANELSAVQSQWDCGNLISKFVEYAM